MTLEQAMGIIARVQMALISHGYSIGSWGPCGDGLDGRWGPDTQEGWNAAMSNAGLPATSSGDLLAALSISEFDAMTLQTAITAWNQWRSQQDRSRMDYHTTANAALEAATGINESTCVGMEQADNGVPPDLYSPPQEKKGTLLWLWILLGVAGAIAAGGGVWYWTQYKKRKKRKKRSGMNGYSGGEQEDDSAGPEITEAEFSGQGEFTYGTDEDYVDEGDEEYT